MVNNMLILMDGTPEAEILLDCSMRLFDSSHNQLNGAFVEGVCSENLNTLFSNKLLAEKQYTRSEIIEKILHTNEGNSDEFIDRFIAKCEELNIKAKVFLALSQYSNNLFDESLYNDLFLIGKSVFNKNNNQKVYGVLDPILYNSRCPLLILDCNQPNFTNIVFIYDGSKRSFDAIKLFIYLLSNQLADSKLLLFVVVSESSVNQEKNVIDYIKNTKLNFSIQRVYPDTYYKDLLTTLSGLKDFLLVSGVNRNEIIEDMAMGNNLSVFLKLNCSIFLT